MMLLKLLQLVADTVAAEIVTMRTLYFAHFAQSWPKVCTKLAKVYLKLTSTNVRIHFYKIACPRTNNTNYLSVLKNAAVFGASLLGVAFTLDTPSVTSATASPTQASLWS